MTETNISIARVPQVTVIDPRIPEKAKLRVAAYARVSSDSEDQVNSYIAQVDFYTKHIAGKEDWEMVDIYADEGISGLEARNRDDFNRMMADCREGKIDRVLCKSISRFARNTQEYIQFVRELLRLGISIHFEKENIDTGKMTSEQVAQIYGAFAQMESTNHSSNMRFSVRMRMEKGLFVPSSVPYGYRLAGRDLEIIPEEAEVVRRIFSAYLSGQGKDDIARELNQLGVDRGRNREKWHPSTVAYILTNISYTGDMIWQKSCATDTIPFRQVRNLGQKPRYFVEHSHPAIADEMTQQGVRYHQHTAQWNKHMVKRILENERYLGMDGYPQLVTDEEFLAARLRRGEQNTYAPCPSEIIPIRDKAVCALCGEKMARDTKSRGRPRWRCKNPECGGSVYLDDSIILERVVQKLKVLAHSPECIRLPKAAPASTDALRIENELALCFNRADINPEYMKTLIMAAAAERYAGLNDPTPAHKLELLRQKLELEPESEETLWEVFESAVAQVRIGKGGEISLHQKDQKECAL